MRRVERGGDLGQQRRRAPRRQCAVARHERAEVVAVDEPHREVQRAVLLAGAEDRHHVRVVERGRDPRLGDEAPPEARVLRQLGRDQLERDGPLERQVDRRVDDAHATAAEDALDAVAGEHGAEAGVGHG